MFPNVCSARDVEFLGMLFHTRIFMWKIITKAII